MPGPTQESEALPENILLLQRQLLRLLPNGVNQQLFPNIYGMLHRFLINENVNMQLMMHLLECMRGMIANASNVLLENSLRILQGKIDSSLEMLHTRRPIRIRRVHQSLIREYIPFFMIPSNVQFMSDCTSSENDARNQAETTETTETTESGSDWNPREVITAGVQPSHRASVRQSPAQYPTASSSQRPDSMTRQRSQSASNATHLPMCYICLESSVTHTAYPCGHTFCSSCAGRLRRETCPWCRRSIISFVKMIFL